MAFDFDETSPADNSYISDFPSNERDARAAKKGAFEVDHELTNGFHDRVMLNILGADPDPAAGDCAVYAKTHGGQPELFFQEESAGDVIQISEAGYLYGVLSLLAGSAEINRKALANILLGKGILLQGHDTAEAAYLDLISLDASDQLIVGESDAGTIAKLILKLASDVANPEEQLLFEYGAGNKKIFHEGLMGSGSGLDADTVDGIEGADLLGWDSDHFFEATGKSAAAGASGSYAHGLGAIPRLVMGFLVCTANDLNYVPGQELPLTNRAVGGASRGLSIYVTTTNIAYKVGSVGHDAIVNRTSGAGSYPNPADWTISLRCWK